MKRKRDESGSDSDSDLASPQSTTNTSLDISPGGPGVSPAVRAGSILRITMQNFMCHENLTVNLGPKMNFITGRNGSGKSTVLAALCVGLGAGANTTQRGSLKTMIMDGKSSALVRIVFCNSDKGRGVPFRHQVYGDEVIVERRLLATEASSAGSSYRLLAMDGKRVSDKKEELTAMLAVFTVPVANPFAILTQDSAKEFLKTTKPTDLYRHIERALLTDSIESNLNYSTINLSEIDGLLTKSRADLEGVNRQYEAVRGQMEKLRELDSHNERKEQLRAAMAWNDVDAARAAAAAVQTRFDKVTADLARHSESQGSYDAQMESLQDKITKTVAAIEQLDNNERPPLETKVSLTADQNRAAEAELDLLKQAEQEVQAQVTDTQRTISDLEHQIARMLEETGQSARAKLTDRRAEVNRQLDTLQDTVAQVNDEADTVSREVDERRDALRECQSRLDKAEEALRPLQQELQRHSSSGASNPLAMFSNYTQNVANAIKREKHRFQVEPVGPLGAYVSIKAGNNEWSRALDSLFGRLLDAFIVFSSDDQRVMQQLLRSVHAYNEVIKRPSWRSDSSFNVGRVPPSSEYTALMDTLDITNEDVRRCLVDLSRIERTILVADRRKGQQVMDRGLRGVGTCISFVADRSSCVRINADARSGGRGTDPLVPATRAPRFQVADKTQLINDIKHRLGAAESTVRQCKDARDSARRELNALEARGRQLNLRRTKLRADRQRLESEAERLEAELESESTSADLTRLQSRVEAEKESHKTLDAQLVSAQADVAEFMITVRARRSEVSAARAALNAIDKQRSALVTTRGGLTRQQDKLRKSKLDAQTNLYELERKRDTVAAQKAEADKTVADREARALEFGPEPNSEGEPRPSNEAAARTIARLDAEIQLFQEQNPDTSEILARFKELSLRREQARNHYRQLARAHKEVLRKRDDRAHRLAQLRRQHFAVINENFKDALSVRGFRGQLTADHSDKALDISIAPTAAQQLQSIAMLSGGERSYSQTALLTSIWQVMNTQLIALDEFDVFMDKVNRKVCMSLVIRKLRDMTDTQSIFISPQDLELGEEMDAEDVTVFRMADPKR